jgi:thiamine pyrophosphate-dependent acetolactate synthase large subunit-like protein
MNPKPRETNMAELDYLPSQERLEEAVWAISKAERPMIFAGAGALKARSSVIALAEKLSAPIATTCRAKGLIPETHPLSMGVLDSLGPAYVPEAAKGCDLMIVIGSGFRQRHLLPKVPSVQLDLNPVAVGRDFPLAVGLIGNARLTVPVLLDMVEQRPWNEFCEAVSNVRNAYWQRIEPQLNSNQIPIAPQRVVSAINKAVASNATIPLDVGHHTYWMGQYFRAEQQEFLISSLVASMGFGFPAGMACALARPDRQTLVVSGDGGFAMVMADFTTAVKYQIPVKIVVFNDGVLSRVISEQAAENIPDVGTALRNPNFAQYAQSAGGTGIRVEDPTELDAALAQAMTVSGPVLVDVLTDPTILARRTQ